MEKGVANAGAPPQANQVPPQDNQVPPQVQDVVIPRHTMDGYIRYVFFTLSQDMTTQAQEVASPDQAMIDQANQEVGPRVQPNTSTKDSHLRDIIRMNSPFFDR